MLLHATEKGNGEPSVIILHGLMGSSANWRAVQDALSETYRVICLDLPNHGASPHIAQFSLQSLAEDVIETMDALGLGRAVIMGHSLGGKVAMLMASEFTKRVRGLIVVDITPRAFDPVHLFTLRACQQLNLAGATRREELDAALAQSIPQPETRDFLLKNVGREDDGSFAWRVPLQYLLDNYRVVSDAVPMTKRYEDSTLFLGGGHSPFNIDRDCNLIRKWFPYMLLTTIPCAGHLVHVNQPGIFLREVKIFIGSYVICHKREI
ncbi:MAG: alpha/beta fold hydrolase [Kiritimatiellaeota bacterium]|nr:alpha/beta fold hydrolase [Kiritimatiellota bacterium]